LVVNAMTFAGERPRGLTTTTRAWVVPFGIGHATAPSVDRQRAVGVDLASP
jgi:hypothetical protein